jgi:hypothetical protein
MKRVHWAVVTEKVQCQDATVYEVANLQNFKMECCDCGLIHNFQFFPVDKSGTPIPNARLLLSAVRNTRLTKSNRKKKKLED